MKRKVDWSCIKCGGEMIGDGYTMAEHCENLDVIENGYAPDEGPIYCRGIANCKSCGGEFSPDNKESFRGSEVIYYFDNDQTLCDNCSKEVFELLSETYHNCL